MNKQKGFTLVELMIVVACVVVVLVAGGGLYVAAHFIGKFW